MTTPIPEKPDTRVSGNKVVYAMFTMAIVATSLLWVYWDLHLQPFMPLQEALAAEFEKSSPRVDGGQRKSHKGTPNVLRVVMRVPFDPNSSEPETQTMIEQRIDGTLELAKRYSNFEAYQLLEVHLFHEKKEQEISQKTFSKELNGDPTSVDSADG